VKIGLKMQMSRLFMEDFIGAFGAFGTFGVFEIVEIV
jgi:hypothetical protein